jgi:putative transposase
LGTKRNCLCDGDGVPLAVCLSGANIHDMKRLQETIESMIIERHAYLAVTINLCLDKGFDYRECEETVVENCMRPHIRRRKEEIIEKQAGKKPRRWPIERTFSWFNRYRRLLIRWEKKPENYLGFLHIACCIMVLFKLITG